MPLVSGQLSPNGHAALLKKNNILIEHVPGGKTYRGPVSKWRKIDLLGQKLTFFEAFRKATNEEVENLQKKC